MEKQSMLLEDLLAGEAHICWHTRSAVIFQGCQLHHLEWAHIYVSWHARSMIIFHTCRLDRLEQAHIYVGLHARSTNNISGPIRNMQFRILSRPTLAGMLYAPL